MIEIEKDFEDGCLALERKKYGQAIQIFENILKENPEYYPALNKMGVIYANKNELGTARKYFEKALNINAEYAPALVNMGNIYKEEGDIANAEKYYIYSIECDQENYLSYYNLAVLYKDKNQYDLYVKYIKSYKRLYKKYFNNRDSIGNKKNIHLIGVIIIIAIIISLIITFR